MGRLRRLAISGPFQSRLTAVKTIGRIRDLDNAPALIFLGKVITYRSLDHRSNQLATELMKRGIGREDIVAVRIERSPEMLIAILGILKAGAEDGPTVVES